MRARQAGVRWATGIKPVILPVRASSRRTWLSRSSVSCPHSRFEFLEAFGIGWPQRSGAVLARKTGDPANVSPPSIDRSNPARAGIVVRCAGDVQVVRLSRGQDSRGGATAPSDQAIVGRRARSGCRVGKACRGSSHGREQVGRQGSSGLPGAARRRRRKLLEQVRHLPARQTRETATRKSAGPQGVNAPLASGWSFARATAPKDPQPTRHSLSLVNETRTRIGRDLSRKKRIGGKNEGYRSPYRHEGMCSRRFLAHAL